VPWETDVTNASGGTVVEPGDVVVGDGDGVIVIPPGLVDEVLDEAERTEAEEAWIADRVAAGESVDGLFPMDSTWRERYEREAGG
jgi:regulator of RNase E activity RraA